MSAIGTEATNILSLVNTVQMTLYRSHSDPKQKFHNGCLSESLRVVERTQRLEIQSNL